MADTYAAAASDARLVGRQPVPFYVAGSGRGATLMQESTLDVNRASERISAVPTYVDPVPGRARQLAERGVAMGLQTEHREARIEELLSGLDRQQPAPLVMNIDKPGAQADVLELSAGQPQPVLGYILVRMPNGALYGIRYAIGADEDPIKRMLALLFGQLAEVTARSGASSVVGVDGRPEHVAAEPAYRRWFAQHMTANLPKAFAGIEADNNPIEVTPDGTTTWALLIRDSKTGWADPRALAADVAAHPETPIVRGEDFAIGEAGPDGIRVHRVRLRKTDGKIAVRGIAALDPESIEAERLRRMAEEALRRAAYETVTRTNPVYTTD